MRCLPPIEIDGDWIRVAVSDLDLLRLQSFLVQSVSRTAKSHSESGGPPGNQAWVATLLESPAIASWAVLNAYRSGERSIGSFAQLTECFRGSARKRMLEDLLRLQAECRVVEGAELDTWFTASHELSQRAILNDQTIKRKWHDAEQWLGDQGDSEAWIGQWLRLVAILQSLPMACSISNMGPPANLELTSSAGESPVGTRPFDSQGEPWTRIWEVLDESCPRDVVLATLDSLDSSNGADVDSAASDRSELSQGRELHVQDPQSNESPMELLDSGNDPTNAQAELVDGFPILLEQLARLDESDQEFERRLHRAKMRSMKELAYGASHEINNPLANISTRAQTLLRDETNPERRQKLAMINSQAFRAHEMISNMMLFAHPPDLSAEELDLNEVISESIDEMREAAERQGTQVRCRSQGERRSFDGGDEQSIGKISADRTHLLVMIQALIRNSLEALGQGGEVAIRLANVRPKTLTPTADDRVQSIWIEVSDNGPGIPQAIREHIFDPFYSGREAGRGLGFGLSKAWRIATMHGGEIVLDDSDEPGARFWVRLPLSPGGIGKAPTNESEAARIAAGGDAPSTRL